GQMLDISLFHWLKRLTGHRFIWLRSTGSTVVSQLLDTVVVTSLAFWGNERLARMIGVGYLLKMLVAVALTPVIYALHAQIHRGALRQQHPQHRPPVLVGEHAEDQVHRPARVQRVERPYQRLGAVGVVGAIEHHPGRAAELFEPPGPLRRGEALARTLARD